eukprot:GHVQ01017257.1.p1 GENE.GHVQ01017257.1~~GHVQ01017257.1.p1  ORF type:complete len:1077 (+),score=128.96 GHVQ01017257.1:3891-7121(+)
MSTGTVAGIAATCQLCDRPQSVHGPPLYATMEVCDCLGGRSGRDNHLSVFPLATRKSPLAMAQTQLARNALTQCLLFDRGSQDSTIRARTRLPILAVSTSADRFGHVALKELRSMQRNETVASGIAVGGRHSRSDDSYTGGRCCEPAGIFTREVEDAVLSYEARIAVHSLKDMATVTSSPSLQIAGVLPRDDRRDAIVLNPSLHSSLSDGLLHCSDNNNYDSAHSSLRTKPSLSGCSSERSPAQPYLSSRRTGSCLHLVIQPSHVPPPVRLGTGRHGSCPPDVRTSTQYTAIPCDARQGLSRQATDVQVIERLLRLKQKLMLSDTSIDVSSPPCLDGRESLGCSSPDSINCSGTVDPDSLSMCVETHKHQSSRSVPHAHRSHTGRSEPLVSSLVFGTSSARRVCSLSFDGDVMTTPTGSQSGTLGSSCIHVRKSCPQLAASTGAGDTEIAPPPSSRSRSFVRFRDIRGNVNSRINKLDTQTTPTHAQLPSASTSSILSAPSETGLLRPSSSFFPTIREPLGEHDHTAPCVLPRTCGASPADVTDTFSSFVASHMSDTRPSPDKVTCNRHPHSSTTPLPAPPTSPLVTEAYSYAYDGLILSIAGLRRLGLQERISLPLSPPEHLYAAGQGAVVLQCRQDDMESRRLAVACTDWSSVWQCAVERGFLRGLKGGCMMPVGVSCTVTDVGNRRRPSRGILSDRKHERLNKSESESGLQCTKTGADTRRSSFMGLFRDKTNRCSCHRHIGREATQTVRDRALADGGKCTAAKIRLSGVEAVGHVRGTDAWRPPLVLAEGPEPRTTTDCLTRMGISVYGIRTNDCLNDEEFVRNREPITGTTAGRAQLRYQRISDIYDDMCCAREACNERESVVRERQPVLKGTPANVDGEMADFVMSGQDSFVDERNEDSGVLDSDSLNLPSRCASVSNTIDAVPSAERSTAASDTTIFGIRAGTVDCNTDVTAGDGRFDFCSSRNKEYVTLVTLKIQFIGQIWSRDGSRSCRIQDTALISTTAATTMAPISSVRLRCTCSTSAVEGSLVLSETGKSLLSVQVLDRLGVAWAKCIQAKAPDILAEFSPLRC